jgi:hypothetical protein
MSIDVKYLPNTGQTVHLVKFTQREDVENWENEP